MEDKCDHCGAIEAGSGGWRSCAAFMDAAGTRPRWYCSDACEAAGERCTATINFIGDGLAECTLKPTHDGEHRSAAGDSWADADADATPSQNRR